MRHRLKFVFTGCAYASFIILMNKHAPDSPSLEYFKFCCQESHILFFAYVERRHLKLVLTGSAYWYFWDTGLLEP